MTYDLIVLFEGHCFFVPEGNHYRVVMQDEHKTIPGNSLCSQADAACPGDLSKHVARVEFMSKGRPMEELISGGQLIRFNTELGKVRLADSFDKSVPKLSDIRQKASALHSALVGPDPDKKLVAGHVYLQTGTLSVEKAVNDVEIGAKEYPELARLTQWSAEIDRAPHMYIGSDEHKLDASGGEYLAHIRNQGTGSKRRKSHDCSFRWYYRYLANHATGRCFVPKTKKKGFKRPRIDSFCPPAHP